MNDEPFQPRWDLLAADEELPLAEAEAPPAEEFLVALAPCWRCGKDIPCDATTCHYCRAPLTASSPVAVRSRTKAPPEAESLVTVLACFGAMLLVMLVFHWLQSIGHQRAGRPARAEVQSDLVLVLVLEAVDTALVAIAWTAARRNRRPTAAPTGDPLVVWLAAAPLLLLLLLLNFAYHWLLRSALRMPLMHDEMVAQLGFTPWVLLAMCVQPAIVEELFFRGLALGRLRDVTGLHTAVLISAVMFGMAHIGAPLSIPYLSFLGVALGYVRVTSGSLLLPMLLHFGHNLAVLYLDTLS